MVQGAARPGSVEWPIESREPMKMARAMVMDKYRKGEAGVPTMWWMHGRYWVWEGRRWVPKDTGAMELEAMKWLEDAHYEVHMKNGRAITRVSPKRADAAEVAYAMRVLCGTPESVTMPSWTGGGDGWDPGRCIPFEDVVVSVEGGEIRTRPRDERWFDAALVRTKWDPEARAPRWERALEEWGGGDRNWGPLLERLLGYLMMGHRQQRKMGLLQGTAGGGKGSITYVVQELVGPHAWLSMDPDALVGNFGVADLAWVRVLSVPEMGKMGEQDKQKLGRIVKRLMGDDPMPINEKYARFQTNVRCRAGVLMSSNPIPEIANEGEGISAKLVVVPFTHGFDAGGGEEGLKERLVREEMPGIAARCVRAAADLERARGAEKWPSTAKGEDIALQYRLKNNPMDAFLEQRFVRDERGFVSSDLVRSEWRDWKRVTGSQARVEPNRLLMEIEEKGSWKVRRERRRREGGEAVRGLRGLLLRKDVDGDL